ncbi:uncharacterized protein LOC114881731 [Osmia bicornis bicornis]|uniref:uncharacterized protein LOC114881731 n=1 Tax=Osmia bicornis bicornis TaxID=1437191 RepID=UPI0010F57F1C|nr:uncharacterized protein LOC114881731 [Osmia bicornis bicornis]
MAGEISAALAEQGTTWSFIPPRAPHFGGLWEAAVRSFMFHFYRIIGETQLTYEEMSTLAAKIEACLNSRPLCAASSSATDAVALTPGHFLTGSSLLALPEPCSDVEQKISTANRWRMLNDMCNTFWRRWQRELVHQL